MLTSLLNILNPVVKILEVGQIFSTSNKVIQVGPERISPSPNDPTKMSPCLFCCTENSYSLTLHPTVLYQILCSNVKTIIFVTICSYSKS